MILTEEQRKAMTFVHAANTGGYRPQAGEVDEWRLRPEPIPRRRGPLLEAARPGRPASEILGLTDALAAVTLSPAAQALAALSPSAFLTSRYDALRLEVQSVLSNVSAIGIGGTPARYGPDIPEEGFVDHLVRLNWVEQDSFGGCGLTALGRALLRAEAASESDADALDVLILGAGDPAAYAKLIGHIADSGSAIVVDPYLKPDALLQMRTHTAVNRVLVGPNVSKADRTEMAVLVNSAFGASSIEVRQAGVGVLHDRYIIGDKGVHAIGSSMNGVGKNYTTYLVPFPDEAADAVRATVERWWSDATVLAATPVTGTAPSATEARSAKPARPPKKVTEKAPIKRAAKKPTSRKPGRKPPAKA